MFGQRWWDGGGGSQDPFYRAQEAQAEIRVSTSRKCDLRDMRWGEKFKKQCVFWGGGVGGCLSTMWPQIRAKLCVLNPASMHGGAMNVKTQRAAGCGMAWLRDGDEG